MPGRASRGTGVLGSDRAEAEQPDDGVAQISSGSISSDPAEREVEQACNGGDVVGLARRSGWRDRVPTWFSGFQVATGWAVRPNWAVAHTSTPSLTFSMARTGVVTSTGSPSGETRPLHASARRSHSSAM